MGLDWHPQNKPKPGAEAEFERLLGGADWGEPEQARFDQISVSPHETLGAPRIGHDPAADAWARAQFQAQRPELGGAELDAALAEAAGYYVLDLVAPCDGLPRYSDAGLGTVEAFSFRAEHLVEGKAVIGDRLLKGAFDAKPPDALLAYGRALLERAEAFAEERGLALERLDTGDPESAGAKLDAALAAGRWCIFWAERGHGLETEW
jgi:GNAT superfamily N-acetyltransferase